MTSDKKLNIRDSILTMKVCGWSENKLLAMAELSGLEYDKKELLKALSNEKTSNNKT